MPEEERGGKSLELELGYGSHKIEDEERGGGAEEDCGASELDEPARGLSEDCGTSEDDETSVISEEPLKSGKDMPAEDSPTIS